MPDLALFQTGLAVSMPMLLGLAGFAVYAGAYLMLCLKRIDSGSMAFYALNGIAAALTAGSLFYSFNPGVFLTQAFFLVASLAAVAIRLRPQPAARRPRPRPRGGARAMPTHGPVGHAHGLCPNRLD